MSKPTPGPWRVEKPEDELLKFRVHMLGGRPTVEIWANGEHGFYHPVALVADDDEANARLISAAPDMLAALTAMVLACDDPNGSDSGKSLAVALLECLPAARAALAKAIQE